MKKVRAEHKAYLDQLDSAHQNNISQLESKIQKLNSENAHLEKEMVGYLDQNANIGKEVKKLKVKLNESSMMEEKLK